MSSSRRRSYRQRDPEEYSEHRYIRRRFDSRGHRRRDSRRRDSRRRDYSRRRDEDYVYRHGNRDKKFIVVNNPTPEELRMIRKRYEPVPDYHHRRPEKKFSGWFHW